MRDKDATNERIIKLQFNKVYGKYDMLKKMNTNIEYIYKGMPLEELDNTILPTLSQKNTNDLKQMYEMCYNSKSNTPFCTTLKENFKPLDNITVDNNKSRENNKIVYNLNKNQSKKNYYANYYNNI